MIRTFRHKGLRELFGTGKSRYVPPHLQQRIHLILGVIEQAETLSDLNIPGFQFHPLRGFKPTRYSIHINGPWCITFEFNIGEARRINLEQYH